MQYYLKDNEFALSL